MKRDVMIRKSGEFLITGVALLTLFRRLGQAQALPPLKHHVREAVRTGQARFAGTLLADQMLQLDVVLPLSDPAALQSFLSALYDPASASYRHYLPVTQFTERFGPSQEHYDALVNFLEGQG